MSKLVIQIPCYNEEETLGITLQALPQQLEGIDVVEILVIDDGSTDRTAEIARAFPVDHLVQLPVNMGLAAAFTAGLKTSLEIGADIIVNLDADNQYNAADIRHLMAPILDGSADMVIGARPIADIEHFSPVKKLLQRLGSAVVRLLSGTEVVDAPSGFRAIGRETAMRLNVFNDYTYTLETIIQAGRSGMRVISVPVRTNRDLRPSRLIKSTWHYATRSAWIMFRNFLVYKPLRTFYYLGLIPMIPGLGLGVRYLWLLFVEGTERSHAPSLILCAILILIAAMLWGVGLLGELMAVNRRLLEDVRFEQRYRTLKRDEDQDQFAKPHGQRHTRTPRVI